MRGRILLATTVYLLCAAPARAEQPPEDTVTVVAVGHIVMGTNYPPSRPSLPKHDGMWFASVGHGHVDTADIAFGNLAAPVSDRGATKKKVDNKRVFAFRSPARYMAHLATAGFDVVNAANNHILDFGPDAYDDTLAGLAKHGIASVGRKGEIRVIEKRGIKVAFVGMTQPYRPFFQSHHDIPAAARLIEKAATMADVVVVGFHGGAEGKKSIHTPCTKEYLGREYRGEPCKLAHALIDAGADLVVGFGPHNVRAMEVYKGKLIAYALGNFLTYGPFNLRGPHGLSIALEVVFERDGTMLRAKAHPYILRRRGIPEQDLEKRALKHLRTVNAADFPDTSPRIGANGAIIPPP